MRERTIILGGVAAGMSAATRLRRLDESADIVVLERGEYVSFANCGLPYFVGGVIARRADLLVQTPESLSSRFALDVRVRHEVVGIDRLGHSVRVRDLSTGAESDESYDHLVLAGGASTRALKPGALPTHTLRSIDDVDAIVELLARSENPRAVVVGGGFIGIEAVENLIRRGVRVSLVQRGDQPLGALDPELATIVIEELLLQGVELHLSATIVNVTGHGVELSDGSSIEADFIIDASGVHPDVALAASASLEIGPSGGIAVDEFQRTSDPAIFAAGDGTEKIDAVDGSGTLVTMAGLANRHGRAIADSIAGNPVPAAAALGTAIVGVFGLTVAMVGWSEKRLRTAARPHRVIHTHPSSHANYYPGAERMSMKLLVDPASDAILGAQIVGGEGVDKRIDVLATAMSAGITASALSRLELAYAPQFGSAKDPINQLGYVASNQAEGSTQTVQWHSLEFERDLGATLIDVRSNSEFAAGAIPGALNIPLDELRARLDELPESPLVVHCQVGQRGHTAARLLTQHGFAVRNLDGGYLTWRAGTAASARLDSPTRKEVRV